MADHGAAPGRVIVEVDPATEAEDVRTERGPPFSREFVAQSLQEIIERDRNASLEGVENCNIRTRAGIESHATIISLARTGSRLASAARMAASNAFNAVTSAYRSLSPFTANRRLHAG